MPWLLDSFDSSGYISELRKIYTMRPLMMCLAALSRLIALLGRGIPPKRGNGEFCWGVGGFFAEEEWFWLRPSSKLKRTFCKYWTSKSKLAWPVCKEYEVKIKMVREQWLQLKMKFLLGYTMKIVLVGGWAFGGGD